MENFIKLSPLDLKSRCENYFWVIQRVIKKERQRITCITEDEET